MAVVCLLVARPGQTAAQESGSGLLDLEYARGQFALVLGRAFPAGELLPGVSLGGRGEYYEGQLGVDLGRHTGLELTASYVEFGVRSEEGVKLSEVTLFALIPSARVRLRLARGRLLPWIAAGAGPAWLRLNDPTPAGSGLIANEDWGARLGIRLGSGFDYFLQPAVSVGAELTYLRSTRDVRYLDETAQAVGAAVSVAAGVRWHVPEVPHPQTFPGVDWAPAGPAGGRPYVAVFAGARLYVTDAFTENTRLDSTNGGEMPLTLAVGTDLSRRVGVDVSGFYHEAQVWGEEKIIEFATWLVAPQLRVMFPLSSRVTPYVTGGIGLGIAETNDARPDNVTDPDAGFGGQSFRLAGTLGAGTDVALSRSLSVVLDLHYVHHLTSVERRGRPVAVNMSGFQPSAGLRIFLL